MFTDWLASRHRFNARMELGMDAWRHVFSKKFLRELAQDVVLLVVLIIGSPGWLLTYCLGRYVEWKRDRKDGITNVKP